MAGLPVAVSKLVSQNIELGRINDAKRIFTVARRLFLLVGLAGTLILAAIAVPWHVLAALANPPYETAEGIFSKNWEGQGFFWYYIMHFIF